ncbi:MAG TPA: hypothetical protein DC047_13440 [Blastocatellia bacterium]|nr:hypothetical protein [Blastocatellia bacterium]
MGQKEPTEIEIKMVLTAPLAFELQASGDAMVKMIKKAPAELQPAALAAALAVVGELQTAAIASVEQLPDYPSSLSARRIRAEGKVLKEFYNELPSGSPAALFFPGLRLLFNVEEMVSPLGSDAPTVPHQLSASLIDEQAELLIEYITRKSLE